MNEAQQILLQSRAISHEGISCFARSVPALTCDLCSPAATAQVQMLLHAARNIPGTTFPFLGALPADDNTVTGELVGELENLLLEMQMRADGGPLQSAVENAVERRKRKQTRTAIRERPHHLCPLCRAHLCLAPPATAR